MSSPIRQEATFSVYQNPDRFKVKFSSLGDWYDVRTVNISTFLPECYSWTSVLDTLKLASHLLYFFECGASFEMSQIGVNAYHAGH